MEAQCPKCENWVECKKIGTLTRKATRKGSVTVVSTTIDPIIPDVDTLIWVSAYILMNDYLNEQVKKTRIGSTTIKLLILI
ncbi:hypothetical protein [Phocaeicola vulgatus]|uniref:hypothetical protein n=1 Tax=Phocaeicola vulgatus TaxID=821 RepID=UPI003DA2F068